MKRSFRQALNPIHIIPVLLSLIIVQSVSTSLFAQAGKMNNGKKTASVSDSLVKKYLADTLNAPKKIGELIAFSKTEQRNNQNEILKFQIALSLAPYAQDSVVLLAHLYAQFSTWLSDAGASDLAIEYARTALTFGNRTLVPNHLMMYHLTTRLGGFYLHTGNYDSARKYYMLALDHAKLSGAYIWIASATNNLGYFYEQHSMPDSALQMFWLAESNLIVASNLDSDLLGSIHDNIAENYFKRNDIDEAAALYQSNVPLYSSLNNYQKLLQAKTGVFSCLLAQKKSDSAFEMLKEMNDLVQKKTVLQTGKNRKSVLEEFQKFYLEKGDWRTAFRYQLQATEIADSLNVSDRQLLDNLIRASTENEMAKSQKDIQLQKMQIIVAESRAKQNFIIAVMIGLLAIAIVSLLILYFRSRQRMAKYEKEIASKELENRKLEQEKLAQELAFRKSDLHELGIYLSEMKELHENIVVRMREVNVLDGRQQKETFNDIIKELDAKTNMQGRAHLIQQNIDKVNREFYDHLIEKYPSLTKSELELCGLLKLNLSNKEIGALKNIAADSVKMSRNRLRKKLGIQPEEDIYQVISRI